MQSFGRVNSGPAVLRCPLSCAFGSRDKPADYFTNPAIFGRVLGERSKETLENRMTQHLQQSVARLFDLV